MFSIKKGAAYVGLRTVVLEEEQPWLTEGLQGQAGPAAGHQQWEMEERAVGV